ncbi:MAG TPA: hypothetical protein VGI66_11540 [Streptosporangiaceae bacterium]
MAVTTFHDFSLASRDREWDGAAAENASASGPTPRTSPTASAATRTSGGRQHRAGLTRGIDLPQSDITRVKSHLAKYYKKMGDATPWERD